MRRLCGRRAWTISPVVVTPTGDNLPVAMIAADFVPTGGMDMPNLALAAFLGRQGRSVEVVSFRAHESLTKLPAVRFHRVPKPLDSYALGAPLLALRGEAVGRRVLERGGRVIANGGNCNTGDVNWVHYVHAAYARRGAPGWRALKNVLDHRIALTTEKRALRRARLVIANSELTRRDLLLHLDLRPERVVVVYYGVDAAFSPPTDIERQQARAELGLGEAPALVFVGAMGDHRKGFDTLFEAWRALGRDWDASLLVVGRGAQVDYWKQRTQLAGVESIRFLGFRADVPRILRAVDGMVAPTRYEAFGQAVQEAVCCGLPVVVSQRAGVVERLGEGMAPLLLGDPESPGELATLLTRWRNGLESFKAVARERAAELGRRSWDVMAEDVRRLMDGETRANA
jgi:glycosyltransferase involved in cell wall biosynthesis